MSIFSKLFNTEKKDFTYNGPRPPSRLDQVQGGAEYYKNLQDRLARRGIGYGDDYVGYANPQVANLRGTFQSYTLPELESELSKTGRRRGTSGFQQIEQAYRNQTLNENDIIGRLAQRQAEAQREDVNNALSGLGDYARSNADLEGRAANFEYDKLYAPQVDREQKRMERESQGYQQLGELGVRAAFMPFTGGASMIGYSPNKSATMGQYNPYDFQNYLPYGRSGNSLNQRITRRATYS